MSSQENIDKVAELCKNTPCWSGVPDDWCDIVAECYDDLVATGIEFTVSQIKEKFGGLRFYITCSDADDYKALHEITDRAEAKIYELEGIEYQTWDLNS